MKRKALVLLLSALLLSACDDKPDEEKGFAGLADDASSYAQVTPDKPWSFPEDHGPHNDFRIEWWYITANLKDAEGQSFGVQWTLFRNALPRAKGVESSDQGWSNRNLWMGHAAVTSADEHYAAERYARGGVGQAGVTSVPFSAWIDNWALNSRSATDNPLAEMQLQARDDKFAYDLHLTASKPLVLQGKQGFSQKSEQGQASYYYSQPFFEANGSIEIDGKRYEVSGPAWLDREWSSQPLTENQTGWDWFSLHLTDGSELMLYRMRQKEGAPYLTGTWINADGSTQLLNPGDIQLEPQDTTDVDGHDMPTQWSVKIPGKGLDITVDALNNQAWMDLQIPYWEGPVTVSGNQDGVGYLEMTGY